MVPKASRPKLDVTQASTERNFITPVRAMNEYLLKPQDLTDLRKFQRRSPYEDAPPITVHLRRDVEARSLQIWGTWDNFQREFKKRQLLEEEYRDSVLNVKKILREYKRQHDPEAKLREQVLRSSGRVVSSAVVINALNFLFKGIAWGFTGSHSLFAETVHSLADTVNQLILYYGIRKSIQAPNDEHPYGYHSARYIASLVSGIGIFCVGTGLSFYHGVVGLIDPQPMESLYWVLSRFAQLVYWQQIAGLRLNFRNSIVRAASCLNFLSTGVPRARRVSAVRRRHTHDRTQCHSRWRQVCRAHV